MKFPPLQIALATVLMGLGAWSWAAAAPLNAEVEGRALARELLAQRPAENSEWRGVLKIHNRERQITTVPLAGRITVEKNGWQIVYTTGATEKRGAEILTVIHSSEGTNQYLYARAAAGAIGGEAKPLTGREADIALAGSDFWLSDLGLDFLHWPVQRLLKKEMRRGQACNVLESVKPHPSTNGYARVVSWIDIDTGGIIQAEAYDHEQKRLKEFAPKEFKKVNGRWELQEMEILNLKTGSRTRLELDLESK